MQFVKTTQRKDFRSEIKGDNKIVIDAVVIANVFTIFYINKGTSLASKITIPNTFTDPTSYIKYSLWKFTIS